MKCYNCTSFSSPSSIILSCLVIPNVTIRFFTEIKSSYLLCWGCSFSKLEQTHEDKYLLSTKKESFSQEEDMGNRRAKHTIDKDLSFIHGGGLYKVWKINGR